MDILTQGGSWILSVIKEFSSDAMVVPGDNMCCPWQKCDSNREQSGFLSLITLLSL